MPVDPRVKTLVPMHDHFTPEREMLAHARRQADELGLDDYFVVDVDSHRDPGSVWPAILEHMENPVMRFNSQHDLDVMGVTQYVPTPGGRGFQFQAMHGRIPHQELTRENLGPIDVPRDVELCRRAMDAMSIDVQVVFPTSLLSLGMSPMPMGESQVAYAYNRWMIEEFCSQEPRLKFLPFLPLNDPDMCLRMIREFASSPSVCGFLVTSIRHDPVHDNRYMPVYAAIEETGLPLAFHAGPTWDDNWMKTMNRFISMHAISFVHCNIVHMTNWLINGLPERFPRLKVIWVESGLAWVPFLMQRLDHEYLKRTSEAPLLKRRPSEYMREMYYTSQPMEMDDLGLARVDAERHQRRDPARVRVRLAALGLRPAERLPRPAVPRRAGEAQHPRPQCRAALRARRAGAARHRVDLMSGRRGLACRRLVAAAHVLEQRGRGPVQRRDDVVAGEPVLLVQHEPRAAGADAGEDRLRAAHLRLREVRSDLGDRRRDRLAARPFELHLGQRPEDVRVLVEEATQLGIAPARSRTVAGSSQRAPSMNSPNQAAALCSRSARVGK